MQINQITWWLVVIGALNWLWAGIFGTDLVGAILGGSILTQIIYILVGLSGLWMLLQKLNLVK